MTWSQEGIGAEQSDRGNDIWNKEVDLRERGSRVSYRATQHHRHELGELSGTLETLSLSGFPVQHVCVYVYVQVCINEFVRLLVCLVV